MSSACYVNNFDSNHALYAQYPQLNLEHNTVELLERLNKDSDIRAVRCLETGVIMLVPESELENPYYWGE